MQPGHPQTASHQNLRILCVIRLVALVGQVLAVSYLVRLGQAPGLGATAGTLLAVFALVIALTWRRSHRAASIGDGEFFGHLLVDVTLFTALLYHTGGAGNPFVSYYLVPITIAAITLPRTGTWLISLISLCAYTGLFFWHTPMPALAPAHHQEPLVFNLHIIGMWVNFAVSALLIAYFVTRMAATLRDREQFLNRQREQQLEDEQLLAVATLAASAAHDLGTPLNTIAVIADDLREQAEGDDPDIDALNSQVERCRQILQTLADTARDFSDNTPAQTSARHYFATVVDRWRMMRPEVNVRYTADDQAEDRPLQVPPSLAASIHNLLNNAGDASPAQVDIKAGWDDRQTTLAIRDYGAGIPAETVAARGPRSSTKADGMGLGIFLSKSILDRHGGRLSLTQPAGDGTLATLSIPLQPTDD